MSSQFTHLHLHTQYSLLDGAVRIKPLPKILQERGFDACAITDHGNMHGVIEFHDGLRRAGIKPIIGLGAYIADGNRFKRDYIKPGPNASHTILLCQNREGYQNLIKLASIAYRDGKFYGKPRIDHDLLEEYNAGLIALSGCVAGEVSLKLRQGQLDEARETAKWYQQVFDGRYYIEVQNIQRQEQDRINAGLINIAKELKIPLVGTNNCHYVDRDDAEAQHILQLMGWQKKITDPDVHQLESSELYLKTAEEMQEALKDFPAECITNTRVITDQCDLDLSNKKYYLPDYPIEKGLSNLEEQLVKDSYKGLKIRFQEFKVLYQWSDQQIIDETPRFEKRLEFELEIINKMGYPGYFLIVADFVKWSKQNGIPVGPGRGSGAGSLVAFCLEITDIDPLKYDLLFERFLNPERISMPDFDIDFETEGREKVINYVRQKYGEENVCQISAIGGLQAKAAIRGVARVLGIPYSEADKISKLIPNELKINITSAIEKEPALQKLVDEGTEQEKHLIHIAKKVEGLNSNLSTHAAGVIIMNSKVYDIIPTCTPSSGTSPQSMYTMEDAENQGAVKFDFLGLRNLTIIDRAVNLINSNRGDKKELNIAMIPLDEQKAYDLLQRGDTTGVFQMESSGMKSLLQKLKPDCFEDIIALVALYRPGPLGSGMVDDYVECKHGRKEIAYAHPLMEQVLKETNGVMVYQEQVMRTVQVLAGFSLGEADLLRRAIGKKKAEVLQQQRQLFVDGCSKNNNIASGLSNQIFDLIDKFAGYGFNKSHSAAYGLVGYQTAWLKAYYPVEFMAALLTTDMSRPESIVKLIYECREMGIPVLPPDINESELFFTTHSGKIRFGLNAIKNAGEKALDSIIEARKKVGGKFEDLLSVFSNIDTSKVNIRVFEALIKSGVFDSIERSRKKILAGLENAMILANAEKNFQLENQVSMFEMMEEQEVEKSKPSLNLPQVEEWSKKERLQNEKESLGFYISGHPLDPYVKELNKANLQRIIKVSDLKDDTRKITNYQKVNLSVIISSNTIKMTKKNDRFSILQVEDLSGSIEVMAFPKVWQDVNEILETSDPVLISGTVNIKDEGVNVIAKNVQKLSAFIAKRADQIMIEIPENFHEERVEKLQKLLEENKGTCNVQLSVPTTNQCLVKLHLSESVNITDTFVDHLENILDEGSFYFTYQKSDSPNQPQLEKIQ
ncbi:MAG: DNA polymerase-3 subunit alpha [bacterium]|jgi:DNA polymerase-3 subunit alpha